MDIIFALSAAIVLSVYGVVLAVIGVLWALNLVVLGIVRLARNYSAREPRQPVRHAPIDVVTNSTKAGIA